MEGTDLQTRRKEQNPAAPARRHKDVPQGSPGLFLEAHHRPGAGQMKSNTEREFSSARGCPAPPEKVTSLKGVQDALQRNALTALGGEYTSGGVFTSGGLVFLFICVFFQEI